MLDKPTLYDESDALHDKALHDKSLCNDALYIGMMSGTSLDGMDAVILSFGQPASSDQPASLKLIATHSKEFPPFLHRVLSALCQPNGVAQLSSIVKDDIHFQLPNPSHIHSPKQSPNQPSDLSINQTRLHQHGDIVSEMKKWYKENQRRCLTSHDSHDSGASSEFDTVPQTQFTYYMSEFEHFSELDWFGWASREYAEFASEVVNEMLAKAQIDYQQVAAIGCHGQTVRHRPQHGFTLQLVDANLIAERTGISVVSDFRRRDMAVGGQGAPLVPAFHQAMFRHPEQLRVILNLGGIANITVLPSNDSNDSNDLADADSINHQQAYKPQVIGYDTGPANLLLDAWIRQHTAQTYDNNGDFARSGHIIEPLLMQLLSHPYFDLPSPKSTGREDFHLQWLETELEKFKQAQSLNQSLNQLQPLQNNPVINHNSDAINLAPADVQATLCELTAISVSREVSKYYGYHNDYHAKRLQRLNTAPSTPASASSTQPQLMVCGGGAFNHYLLERLAHHLPDWHVLTTAELGLEPTWVEATAFAWLARQTLLNETGNLPEVTGASKAVVLGQLCEAETK